MAKKKQPSKTEETISPEEQTETLLDNDLLGEESSEKKLVGYHPITGVEVYQ